ncbi:MAG: DUF4301 family protein [Calditrichia bacterium]
MSISERVDTNVFTESDLRQFAARGIDPDVVSSQLKTFEKGIPFAALLRSCTPGDGIVELQQEDLKRYEKEFAAVVAEGRVQKFVPASGAASRMFRQLLASYEQLLMPDENNASDDLQKLHTFIEKLPEFAFYDVLKARIDATGETLENLLEKKAYHKILAALLDKEGLDYRNLPKGMVAFHTYKDGTTRNPIEEHLVEAVEYARASDGTTRLHFTVPAVHLETIRSCVNEFAANYDDVNFLVTYSIQKPSTDTIAVDSENRPFRNPDGMLLFRPGGHGALLENLNDLKGDVVFIKNIDNVVPDHLKADTYRYKKALGGYLANLQAEMFGYLHRLEENEVSEAECTGIQLFAEQKLGITFPEDFSTLAHNEKCNQLFSRLNRPLRICGMVRNEGEPGGGPFWIRDSHGDITAQIVESSQIDISDTTQLEIVQSSTHFNPVDLICGVRNYRGKLFHLPQFADPTTGFISKKSKSGRELKALELPGLWNGAMAFWNTVFVEVPISTFSPVKTVFDLLRATHQPE